MVVQKFREKYGWSAESFNDLRNYLADRRTAKDIKKFNAVINDLRIFDPAVGSGHFLVSALNEIIAIKAELGILADEEGVRFRDFEVDVANDELLITDDQGNAIVYQVDETGKALNKEIQRLQCALFHEKQYIIENCLFGVDINSNSVKICRLRLWIELLKHAYYKPGSSANGETIYPHYPNYVLETLPNIDINIKTGNSLVSRFSLDTDLTDAFKTQRFNLETYKLLVSAYRSSRSRSEKAELISLIEGIKKEYTGTIYRKDSRRKKIAELRGQLELARNNFDLFGKKLSDKEQKTSVKKIEDALQKKELELEEAEKGVLFRSAFEWRFEFPEVLDEQGNFMGFDVIVGNPPYVQIQKLPEDDKKALETQQYETYTRTGDLYQLFYERGINLLRDQGKLCLITSNKWMRTNYGGVTRKLLAEHCRTETVIDFGMAQMFDVATTYTNILVATKAAPAATIRMCRINEDYESSVLLDDYVDFASVEIANPSESSWIAYDREGFSVIRKIVEQGKPLKDWQISINRGLLTGFNEAFIIDTDRRNQLVAEDPECADLIVPILRGEDIKAYVPEWKNKWLINTHNGIKEHEIERIDVLRDYPSVLKHFLQYQTALEKRYDKGDHWTNLRNCAYLEEFAKPKIIYPNMTKFLPFVYDKHQFFTNDKSFILTGEKLEFLTCFLNSSLFKFAFKDYFPELLGDTRELRKVFFETIPVKEPTDDQSYKNILEDILTLKEQRQATNDLEQKMDELIFDLYDLTADERTLILSTAGKSTGSRELISDMSLPES